MIKNIYGLLVLIGVIGIFWAVGVLLITVTNDVIESGVATKFIGETAAEVHNAYEKAKIQD